jgi:hypothetical protein
VAPLRFGGLRGKKSTPSVGLEVPVRSHRSASRSWTERAREETTKQSCLAKVCRLTVTFNKIKFTHVISLCSI